MYISDHLSWSSIDQGGISACCLRTPAIYITEILLKKLVQLGCISEGFRRRSHQPKVLIHQTFQQLTTSGLQSVCVTCVRVTSNDEWDKNKLIEIEIKRMFVS